MEKFNSNHFYFYSGLCLPVSLLRKSEFENKMLDENPSVEFKMFEVTAPFLRMMYIDNLVRNRTKEIWSSRDYFEIICVLVYREQTVVGSTSKHTIYLHLGRKSNHEFIKQCTIDISTFPRS